MNMPTLMKHNLAFLVQRLQALTIALLIFVALPFVARAAITSDTPGPNLVISSTTETRITLAWNKNPDATGYEFKKVHPTAGYAFNLGNTIGTVITGVKPATKYGYVVRAVQGNAKSQFSAVAYGYTKPVRPAGFYYSFSGTTMTVGWDPVATGGTKDDPVDLSYQVQLGNRPWVNVTGTSRSFENLTLGTRYNVKVRARIAHGSKFVTGNPGSIQVNSNNAPSAPGSPSATSITADSFTLSWTASSGTVKNYQVSINGGAWTSSTADDTTHSFSGLSANTEYTLRVRARNGPAISPPSEVKVLTLPDDVPGAPGSPSTSDVTKTSITLSWTASTGAVDSYEVSLDGSAWTGSDSDTSHSFTGLTANTAYTLQVRAKNVIGTSTVASAASVTTLPSAAPGKPTSLATSQITKTSAQLGWFGASGVVDSYEVKLDDGDWTNSGSDLAHVFTGLRPNNPHILYVRAKNRVGVSPESSIVALTLPEPPNAPSSPTTSSVTATSITLSWNTPLGRVDTYEVSSDGGSTWIDSTFRDRSHTFTGLTANTAYTLQVRAKNVSGTSPAASAPSVTTLPAAAPGAPTNPTSSAVTASSITLTWTAGTGVVDTYEVSSDGGTNWIDSTSADTSHSFTGLSANTAYTLQVRAKNRAGDSSAASAASVKTLPAAPTSPTTSSITATSITLSWTASVGGADTYEVSADGSAWTDAGGGDTNHVFSSLDANTSYTLQVRAKNATGASSAASAAAVTTLPSAAPAAPTNPTSSAVTASSITLTWTASTGVVDTYEVSSDGGTNWIDSTSADTSHSFTGLSANTAYTLQVRAKNRAGTSSAASAASVKTLPAAPTGASTSAITASSITLSWTASAGGADTYEVSIDGSVWTDAGGGDTEHVFSGLSANTSYTLQVRAKNGSGATAAVSATAVKTLPAAPTSPTTSAISASSITLSWTASAGGADTYEVSTDGSVWTDAGGGDTEHVFSGLSATTSYTLQVRAKNVSGASPAASAPSVTTLPAAAPAAPTDPTSSAVTASSITLTWTASTGVVDTYEVSSDGGTNWIDSTSADTSHSFTGLSANTAYTLQVRAKNRSGDSSAASAASVKTLPAAPTSPTTSSITATSITLSWTASVGGADTYEVSSDGGTNWIDSTSADTSHSFSGLSANTAYTLQVRAKNASGATAAVSAAAVKTLPAAPTSPTTSAISASSITLSWTASAGGADTYEVSTDGSVWTDAGGGDTEHVFSGLSANTSYTLQVRAKNDSGATAAVSATAVKTLPAAPTSPTTSAISASSITLSWTASAGGADTYEVSTDGSVWADAGGGDTEHVFSGLSANTSYTLQARAKNGSGATAAVSATAVKTLPAAPSSPTTSAISASSITLSWTASVGGADTYEVSKDGGNTWVDAGGGDLSHTFENLDPSTAYSLQARAKNSSGVSAATSAIAATTLAPATQQPSNLSPADQTATHEANQTATKVAADLTATHEANQTATKVAADLTATHEANLTATKAAADLTATHEANQTATKVAADLTATHEANQTATKVAADLTATHEANQTATKVAADLTATHEANQTATKVAADLTATHEANQTATKVAVDLTATHEANQTATKVAADLTATHEANQTATKVAADLTATHEANQTATKVAADLTATHEANQTATRAAQPPDPPANLQSSGISQNSVQINWQKSEGAESYEVMGWIAADDQPSSQAANKVSIYNNWINVGDTETYTFQSLNPDTQYSFGVHAMSQAGASEDSMVDVKTMPEQSAAPLNEDVTADEGGSEDSGSRDSGDADKQNRQVALPSPTVRVSKQTLNELPEEIIVRYWLDGAHGRRVGPVEISDAELIQQGIVDAIDLWGYVTPGVEVCFKRRGDELVFMDAATTPRTKLSWLGYASNGMTCTIIDRPGTMVLLGDTSSAGAGQPIASQPGSTLLSDCVVELTEYLNFRESPWGAIINILAPGIGLTAVESADGWYKVDFYGRKGWIIGDSVIPIGNCTAPQSVAQQPAAQQPAATAPPPSSALSDCMVELTEYLNFRDAPWGNIIHQLASGIRLTALEYADGWYKVDYYGRKGWIIGDYVIPVGSC